MQNNIIDLITEDRAFEAIQLLKEHLSKRSELNTLTGIEGRLNSLNSRVARGVISPEAAALERNQIRDGLLELVRPTNSTATDRSSRLPMVLGGIACLLVALLAAFYFLRGEGKPPPVSCTKHKTAIRVANFLDQESAATDPFSSSIMTAAVEQFNSAEYDISGIGLQVRSANYHEAMLEKHFNRQTTCDTSGVLLNGVLSPEHQVFNVWITLANLTMQAPELLGNSELSLNNPPNIEFSMPEDARFIVDFVFAILMNANGEPLAALEQLLKLEKEHHEFITTNPSLKANIAFIKGNAYALRGDKDRALAQYDIVVDKGGADLAATAVTNKTNAERMYLVMVSDPQTRQVVLANQRKHLTFEQELARFFRNVGRTLDKIFRGL